MKFWKQIFSVLVSACLVVGMLPTVSLAAEDNSAVMDTNGLCEHHTAHDETCGYVEGSEGSPCTHEHGAECYTEITGCIHEHDEDCGYVPAVEAHPCTYVCELCGLTEIKAWNWVDEMAVIDPSSGILALAGAENPVLYDQIVDMLPAQITATTTEDGTETVTLGGWICDNYPEAGADTGSYRFTAALPDGYALAENVPALTVTVELGGVAVLEGTEHNHPICGAAHTDIGDHTGTCEDVAWTAWNGTDEITYDADTSTAYVYLTDNVDITSALYVETGNTLYLCLNGHSITKSKTDEVIYVWDGAQFILCDCQGGGRITHSNGVTGRGMRVGGSRDEAAFFMYGGEISGNHAGTSGSGNGKDGAGVEIQNSTFKMYGGKIRDNHVDVKDNYGGGGVCAQTSSRFYMYGGEISNNESTYSGGGVVVWGGGSVKIDGGEIRGNTAAERGGGIYTNASLEIAGGTISGNKATNGGGVYYRGNSEMRVLGGAGINQNTATDGGGIYVDESSLLRVSDGSITGNTVTGNGGGVFNAGTFIISGNVDISGNQKGNADNNVYLPTNKYITITGELTGGKIGVTTEATPDSSSYVRIATGNKNYADPEKFQYENDETSVSAITSRSGSTATLVVCKHNLSSNWSVDVSNHWHNCLICNGKMNTAAHVYDQEVAVDVYKASDATCTSGAIYYKSCACGRIGAETFEIGDTNPDNHSGTLGDWQSDGSNHWKEYSCCGVHAETAAHTGGTATCQNQATCDICNQPYGELGSHDPASIWSKDASGHWHVCRTANCTEKIDFAAHTPGAAATEETPQTCTECGYEIAPALEHTHDWGGWTSNGDGTHTRICKKDSSHTETNSCSGGTATCQSPATCSTCAQPYGDKDMNNHTGGTEVRGSVEATTNEAGYTGDTYCKGCNTKIQEGKTIPKKDNSPSEGGNDSSSDSNTPSISVTVPVSGDENTIRVDAAVSGTMAIIETVDFSKLDTVIGNDVKTGVVTIDFSVLEQEVDTVKIPADVVKQIAGAVNDPNNDAEGLAIVLTDGTSIEFDAKSLDKNAAQANGADISISIRRTTDSILNNLQQQAVGSRPALDINVTSGGSNISDMGGKVTVYAPYELRSDEQASGIVVYYVDVNGNKEPCETGYDPVKKRVNWKTDHFSIYMIGYDESKGNAGTDSDSSTEGSPETPATEVTVPAYVTYTVQKGDILWAIAKKYGRTISEIVAANSSLIKNPDLIYPGWQLKIPQDGTMSADNTPDAILPDNKKTDVYIVKRGDTLWAIARKYGCTVAEIFVLNGKLITAPDLIFPGWELKIPQN